MTKIEGQKTWEEMAAEPGSIVIGPASLYKKSVNKDGVWVGITEWHKDKDGDLCGGWVPMKVEGLDPFYAERAWTVVSLEPLHLEPSLLCNCGNHGWIRDGKWVAA